MDIRTTCAALALSFVHYIAFSQDDSQKRVEDYKTYKNYVNIGKPDGSIFLSKDFQREMGVSQSFWKEDERYESIRKVNHIRYKQFYKSLEILGGIYNVHQKNGQIISSNGYFLPDMQLDVANPIDMEKAIKTVNSDMRQELGKINSQYHINSSILIEVESSILKVGDISYPNFSGNYSLVYDITLKSNNPYDRKRYIVNAQNGCILSIFPLILTHSVQGLGVCKYYGKQDIIIDSVGPNQFVLADSIRNVFTKNSMLEEFQNESTYWDLTNSNMDEVALDAHYCTEQFYDFLNSTFEWKGIDNQNGSMISLVHGGGPFGGAYWDGTYASFGDGGCHAGPYTTLEVVAHEYAHGITDYTSDLIYRYESGAINESFSDVLAKALEYYVYGEVTDWTIGASRILTDYGEAFRSIEDPNSFSMPEYYRGLFWSYAGEVHVNSSLGNYWFYLLSNGVSGVNEVGQGFNVTEIGMDKALQILFLTQRSYLFPNARYLDYYELSRQACLELYGNGVELAAVTEAWRAVGLPFDSPPQYDLELSIDGSNLTSLCNTSIVSYPIILKVRNVGDRPYTAGSTPVSLILMEDTVAYIDQDLEPGASLTIPYNIEINHMISNHIHYLYFYLRADDESEGNDETYYNLEHFRYSDNNLLISLASLRKVIPCHNTFKFGASIYNISCNPFKDFQNTRLAIFDQFNNEIWSDDVETTIDVLDKGANFYYTTNIIIDKDLRDVPLHVRLIYEGDPYLYDNRSNITSSFPDVNRVGGNYFQDFESDDIVFGGPGVNGIGQHLNSVALLSTGWSIGYFVSEITYCPILEDNFDILNLPYTLVDWCVDFTGMGNISLDFDLTQYQNDNLPVLNHIPLGSLSKLTIFNEGEVIVEDIFYNQEEGVQQHYQYNLPDNFVGTVSFDFLCMTGVEINHPDFFDYDVNVLDNFRIQGDIISSTSDEVLFDAIYPNPSQGRIRIDLEYQKADILICDLNGKVLITKRKFDLENDLDIGDLPNGVYIININIANEYQANGKVVKMNN